MHVSPKNIIESIKSYGLDKVKRQDPHHPMEMLGGQHEVKTMAEIRFQVLALRLHIHRIEIYSCGFKTMEGQI